MSNFGAYWLGALVGLIFAVALGATLSVVSPLPGEKPMETAAAPAQPAVETPAPEATVETEAETEAEPSPQPEPEAETQPEPQPQPEQPAAEEPTVTAEAEPTPAPAPAPEATPAPETEPTPEPETTTAPTPEPETAEETPAPAPAVNALRDHSERYRGDESQPLLSIVLVDLGDPKLNIAEIFLLPAPLTVVVDAKADNAEDLVADARDAGFEAMVTVNQTAVENLDALLEDAGPIIGVATLDGGVSSPEAISSLTDGLTGRNMGLFDASNVGGGAVYRAAQAINLPAAPAGRRFDDSPNSEAVYQALERAAFDARRAGAFVVYARPDPAIMTGLRRWMSLKANRSVAVAPLSTVMRKLARQ